MISKGVVIILGSSLSFCCAFVIYRFQLTRKEALKRFEESEDGRRLTLHGLSFAPKMDSYNKEKSEELINEYIARDRMKLKK